jgi:TonB family protein
MQRVLACIVVAVLSGTSLSQTQRAPAPPNPARKIAKRVEPDYPELARRMHMRGAVRIEAVVRANGSVRSTRVLGGNPLLSLAAGDAVGKWKFEVAPNETVEIVQLNFESK